jgi:PAS domain S-box-containing protein
VFAEYEKRLEKKIETLLLIYIPALFVIFLELNNLIADDLVLEYWGWVEVNSLNWAFISASIWTISYGLLSLFLCYRYFRKVDNPLKRQQAKFVFLGLLIPNFFGTFSQILSPLLELRLPDLTIPSFGLCIIVIAYAILKYNLFILTYSTAAESILASLTEIELGITSEKRFDLVYALDCDGRIIYVSPSIEKILGYHRKDTLGNYFHNFLAQDSLPKFKKSFKNIMSGTILQNAELEVINKEGSFVPILINSIPIIIDGEVHGIQGIARDLTEFKKVEKTKIELEKSRESFIAMTSHELRTPLTVIRGYTDFLINSYPNIESSNVDQILQTILQNVYRLEHLIQDVIDIDKVKRQSFNITTQKMNFEEFLTDSITPYKNILGDKLKYHNYLGESVVIKGDQIRLAQVLDNLISNAVKHTSKPDREIVITTRISKGSVQVSVNDNGAGIDNENLKRIFNQFVSIPTKYSVTGTGIGLYIAKIIIEFHNGTIVAQSEGIGKGSAFIFELPLNSN